MNEHSATPAFIFDLDGTLVDSVYQHVLAWREALERAGMQLSVWSIHRRIGMSGGLLVNALLRETHKAITTAEAEQLQRFPCGGVQKAHRSGSAASRRKAATGVPQRCRRSPCHCDKRAD